MEDTIPDSVQFFIVMLGLAMFVAVIILSSAFAKAVSKKHSPPSLPVTAGGDDLAQLARIAERLERRLDALEALMDAENPHWRK